MQRRCADCEKTKDIDCFYSYAWYCKDCCKRRAIEWRANNKSKTQHYHQTYYIRCHIILKNLKINGCAICGYDKCTRALHFHHVNPIDKNFSVAIVNIEKKRNDDIVNELNKCILLCCNCHMEIEE